METQLTERRYIVMIATGYKLVQSIGNYSLLADGYYRLQYLPGTTVKARQDTLGVMFFYDIASVRQFVDNRIYSLDFYWEYISLLEIRYDTNLQLPYTSLVSRFTTCRGIQAFYDGFIDNYEECRPPRGTVICPEVYVVREILTGYKS